ncbi:hypothetical protein CONPUDRAFT_75912 [Coniophora puteana RWD-64-598 SS2]|uniref:Uncharacterized protein n=1 Tax=Coniophora puteana (strain RWD-64-598) TaxID=741705 RepID=A0A5M3MD14_CONPW|nr:uncharacterized protein CONPUDRAFT_75912 [Coniophora puteana RWD-64-598 SS2]EIW77108.1 hypothetical protein CONPUDRAFT_75912 [Coniophora puteana RWD-64-598 SS2]
MPEGLRARWLGQSWSPLAAAQAGGAKLDGSPRVPELDPVSLRPAVNKASVPMPQFYRDGTRQPKKEAPGGHCNELVRIVLTILRSNPLARTAEGQIFLDILTKAAA